MLKMANNVTAEQLKYIKDYNLNKKKVYELLDYIAPLWHWNDWGFQRTLHKFELYSGGWSGNEDIIKALQDNELFWSLYWVKSECGGHYFFEDRHVNRVLKGFVKE